MTALQTRLLDGKATAAAVRAEIRTATEALTGPHGGPKPGLTVVLVGDDPASHVYVRNKDRAATEAGFAVNTIKLPATASQQELMDVVEGLNADAEVHGILVQLPLPKGLDADAVIDRLDPAKDVDGLSARSVAAWAMGTPGHRPCTPAGCLELLDRHGVDLAGKHVVVVGRSMLVGKPFATLALGRNATVTICHSRTKGLEDHCRRADVLVAAVGRARMIPGDWIQPGAVVLDVGINRGEDGKLCGDVDTASAEGIAAAITPVPGGIGPMTIALLLRNTFCAAAATVGLDGPALLGEAAGA